MGGSIALKLLLLLSRGRRLRSNGGHRDLSSSLAFVSLLVRTSCTGWIGVGQSEKSSALSAFSKRATQLLERPIHKILDEIEQERLNPPPAPVEPLTEANLARVDNKGKGKKKESEMWTDRYRPKKFTDLLGDDVLLPLVVSCKELTRSIANEPKCHVLVERVGFVRLQVERCKERKEESDGC